MVEEYIGECLCLEEAPKTSSGKRLLLGGTDKARKDRVLSIKRAWPLFRECLCWLVLFSSGRLMFRRVHGNSQLLQCGL